MAASNKNKQCLNKMKEKHVPLLEQCFWFPPRLYAALWCDWHLSPTPWGPAWANVWPLTWGVGPPLEAKERAACMPADFSYPYRRWAIKPPFEPYRNVTAAVYKTDHGYNVGIKWRSERGWRYSGGRGRGGREGSVNDDLGQCPQRDNYILSYHTSCWLWTDLDLITFFPHS